MKKIEERLYEKIWSDVYRDTATSPIQVEHEHATGTLRIDETAKFVPSADRLLDIGCGDGQFCELVRSKFRERCGVDISEAAVSVARQRGINAVQHNVHDGPIPWPDESFDVITAGAVIEHIFEPDYLISESFRLLRRGGLFIVNTPNIRYLRHVFTLIAHGQFPRTSGDTDYSYDGGHIHYFTTRDLRELFIKHGFLVNRLTTINTAAARHHPLYRLLSLLGSRFRREFLGAEILIAGRKPE